MGWWEGFSFEPNTMEMIFDPHLAPLYGWMFPEGPQRVDIAICIDGQDADGRKTERNVREVFARFLEGHFGERLRGARQVGRFKGHPIVHTTWIAHLGAPGRLATGMLGSALAGTAVRAEHRPPAERAPDLTSMSGSV
jgi:hypothetical protein